MKMIQLTMWESPWKKIESQYGKISWGTYLHFEQQRISSDVTRSAEVRQMGELCALWVNTVKGCLCDECRGQ